MLADGCLLSVCWVLHVVFHALFAGCGLLFDIIRALFVDCCLVRVAEGYLAVAVCCLLCC